MIQTDTNEDHPGVPGLLLNCFSPKCMLKSHRPVSLGEVIMEDDVLLEGTMTGDKERLGKSVIAAGHMLVQGKGLDCQ